MASMGKPTVVVPLLLALGLTAVLIAVVLDRERFKPLPAENRLDDRVVASVGSRSITLREIESAASLPLYLLETQRRQLLLQAIQRRIDEELIETEASLKGLTVQDLLDQASQSESIARMANAPGPVRRIIGPANQAAVDGQERARLQQALIVSLRRKADIQIMLPPVEPPIVPVNPDDDPRLGPDDAPVTIIEFSDFQCPFCQKSVPVLQELRRMYGDKISLIYRDFPGQNHPNAFAAAEASECAHEQGKFWEYHDLLFNRQAPDRPWNFEGLAAESGLDVDAFRGCVNRGRFRTEVRKDLEDGLRLGVTSTPTFFVNGRPLVGLQSIPAFQQLIDKALLAG
jgi:protein-disulfide isomerase